MSALGPSDGVMAIAMLLRWLAPAHALRKASISTSNAMRELADAFDLLIDTEEETRQQIAKRKAMP